MTVEESLVRHALRDAADTDKTELVLLRAKLEVRSWFLRVSLALNTGLVAGVIARVVTK